MAASVFLDANIVLDFLLKRKDYIEDALQYYTAIHHKIDFFLSKDKKLKKDALTLLPVYDIPGFLGLLDN